MSSPSYYYCIVCKTADTSVSHHEFPTHMPSLISWLRILKLEPSDLSVNSHICGKHFHPSSYFRPGSTKLLPGALPNKLEYNPHNIVTKSRQKKLGNSNTAMETSETSSQSTLQEKTNAIKIDHNRLESVVIDFTNPVLTKKLFRIANDKVKSYTKQIKTLQQSHRRQQKRINKLLVVLRALKAEVEEQ